MSDPDIATDPVSRAKADIQDLNRKINQVQMEQARLQTQMRQLEAERTKIQAFVQMYERYAVPRLDEPVMASETAIVSANILLSPSEPTTPAPLATAAPTVPNIERKPEGTPPMPVMIEAALKDAVARGRDGLEPREMTDFIRRTWWPTVKGESVSPIAWRMVNQGRLKKKGTKYRLAN